MKPELEHERAVQKLAELIGTIRIAMLTTVADDGTLWSRPITTQRAKFDGDLWFITKLESAKVQDVSRHQRVSLCYVRMEDNTYVSISGLAQVISDPIKAAELWDEAYKDWFPKGPTDPSLAAIHIIVERAEYWDAPSLTWPLAAGFVVLAPEQFDNPEFHARIILKKD